MTQEEIIDIYKKVSNELCNGKEWCWNGVGEPVQLFAKLLAQQVRDKIMFGSRDDWVLAEREACAKLCEAYVAPFIGKELATAIRARGEQAQSVVNQQLTTEQEPVVNYCRECLTYNGHQEGCSHYTTPPQRQWVGLTDEQLQLIANRFQANTNTGHSFYAIARAIEAAHGIGEKE